MNKSNRHLSKTVRRRDFIWSIVRRAKFRPALLGLATFVLTTRTQASVNGQSWDSINDVFNGSGGFTAKESANPWTGPRLQGSNGGTLTFVGSASHNRFTTVESGTAVIVNGSFNHSNTSNDFRISGDNGQGANSSFAIGDVANSNVNSGQFQVHGASLSLNSVTAASHFHTSGDGTLNVLSNVSVGGFTRIESGRQVVVGGSFNHNNALHDFGISGDNGQGTNSSLTIGDVANSNVSSARFDLHGSSLSLNSISAASFLHASASGTLNVLSNVAVGGETGIESGRQVIVGGDFTKTNLNQDFSVDGVDDFGNRSTFQVGGTADIEARSFRSSGRTEMSGNAKTASDAVLFGESIVARDKCRHAGIRHNIRCDRESCTSGSLQCDLRMGTRGD